MTGIPDDHDPVPSPEDDAAARPRARRVSDLARCPHCGDVVDRARTCSSCGAKLGSSGGIPAVVLAGIVLALALPVVMGVARTASKGADAAPEAGSAPEAGRAPAVRSPKPRPAAAKPARREPKAPVLDPEKVKLSVFALDGHVGSAFRFGSKGEIMTLARLLESETSVEVSGSLGAILQADVVDEGVEGSLIAVLKIREEPPGEGLPLGDATRLVAGTHVTAVGFGPGSGSPTLTQGIVSAAPMVIEGIPLALVQVDASVLPGFVGGPLLDGQGKVVGILLGSLPEAEGMNFALPINYAPQLGGQGTTGGPFDHWRAKVEQAQAAAQRSRGASAEPPSLLEGARLSVNTVAAIDGVVILVKIISNDGRSVLIPYGPVECTVTVRWTAMGVSPPQVQDCSTSATVTGDDFYGIAQRYAAEAGVSIGSDPTAAILVPCPELLAAPGGTMYTVRMTTSGIVSLNASASGSTPRAALSSVLPGRR